MQEKLGGSMNDPSRQNNVRIEPFNFKFQILTFSRVQLERL